MSISNNKGAIIKFTLFIIIFMFVVLIAIKFAPWIVDFSKNPVDAREYMLSIEILGYALFLLIQIAHVIIAVIPGDILYVLGGFVFGVPMGFILSYVGVMTGSIIVFYFSRLLGYDFVNKFIPKEKIDKISNVLNSTKGMFGLFIICLIPIIPKDPLMYVSGLTPIKPSRLFTVYAISRIPVTLMWVIIGANTYEKNYFQAITTISILILIAILGLLIQKKMLKKPSR